MANRTIPVELFSFEGSEVQAVTIDGEPLAVMKNITDILGFSDAAQVSRWLDEDDYVVLKFGDVFPGQSTTALDAGRRITMIRESGIYELIFRSPKPEAKAFKRWVMREVLPSLRKTGNYSLSAGHTKRLAIAEPRAAVMALFESTRGFSVADVGAMNGLLPMEAHRLMRDWGATYRMPSGGLYPSQLWMSKGWMIRRGAHTPVFTAAGLVEVARRLGRTAITAV